jgi:hypothetical protein
MQLGQWDPENFLMFAFSKTAKFSIPAVVHALFRIKVSPDGCEHSMIVCLFERQVLVIVKFVKAFN